MQFEAYFDFLGPNEIRIKGHRIGIEHVLEYYADGYSPEQIANELPGLSLEAIHATITYYWHNQAEIEQYLKRLDALSEEQYNSWAANLSPVIQRLRQIRTERARQSA